MRASRLLQILLLLQNRGRLTAGKLAEELEVTPRTILRDVDAMTEAGLPIIVIQGNKGGIELGFNYRTRLTGLDETQAEALGAMLGTENPALRSLGLDVSFRQARSKLLESFPDRVRETVLRAVEQYQVNLPEPQEDPRVPAIAAAVRSRRKIRINVNCDNGSTLHPVGLRLCGLGWFVTDGITGTHIALSDCGDINISAHKF